MFNTHEIVRSEVDDCIAILSEPFEQFSLTFDQTDFIEHLSLISNLSKQITQTFRSKITDIDMSIYRSYFIFISKYLLPQWEYYGFYSQMLKLFLLKFWYLILLSLEKCSDPLNLLMHIASVNNIYFKLSKSSLIMQKNYSICWKYIEGHIERNKIAIDRYPELLCLLVKSRHETYINENIFNQLWSHSQSFKSKVDSNELGLLGWMQVANIQEWKTILQCLYLPNKLSNSNELSWEPR